MYAMTTEIADSKLWQRVHARERAGERQKHTGRETHAWETLLTARISFSVFLRLRCSGMPSSSSLSVFLMYAPLSTSSSMMTW